MLLLNNQYIQRCYCGTVGGDTKLRFQNGDEILQLTHLCSIPSSPSHHMQSTLTTEFREDKLSRKLQIFQVLHIFLVCLLFNTSHSHYEQFISIQNQQSPASRFALAANHVSEEETRMSNYFVVNSVLQW